MLQTDRRQTDRRQTDGRQHTEEDKKKLQGKNIMVCPITYGDHN